jgi:hypothetical protein
VWAGTTSGKNRHVPHLVQKSSFFDEPTSVWLEYVSGTLPLEKRT